MNVAIYRILGNSLPPRHDAESALRNLRYILEHEAPFPECTKHWILNGLLDPVLENACRELIEAAGQECHCLPFDGEGYRLQFLDASGLPEDLRRNYPPESDPTLIRNRLAIEWIYRHKSIAAININRARNLAITLGRRHARWTIPLDGGCYFKTGDWLDFTRVLESDDSSLYALIPMLRLESNEGFMEVPGAYPIEPQIAFRDDAPDRFDERLRYGNRNKAEFLVRIAAPGPWHGWKAADWDDFSPMAAKSPGRFLIAGRAYRLETGASPRVESHERQRHAARFEGIVAMTQTLDRLALQSHMSTDCAKPVISSGLSDDLRAQCEQLLGSWQQTLAEGGWPALRNLWALPIAYGCGSADPRLIADADALLRFMETGKEGLRASLDMNTDGIWMHLSKLGLSLFTGKWPLASRLLNYASLRLIAMQSGYTAGQTVKLEDRISQINAWVLLARLGAFAGVDVARYKGVNGESIAALLADLARTGPESPEWQAEPQRYQQWLEMMQALLDGRTSTSPVMAGNLMPDGWEILAGNRQSGPTET